MAMIEVADLCAIREKDPISQPVEAVGQDDFALGSLWGAINSGLGNNLVAIAQVDLTLVWVGECMWLPKRHVSIIAGK